MDLWRETMAAILDDPGIVVMLGPVDVGKTTLATAIASRAVDTRHRAAVVDADVGQSDLGPPTTVGAAVPRRPATRMDEWRADAAFFVGDTSPQHVYRYLVEGAVRSVAWARARGAQVIVVDTTGWVEGEAAVAAKVHKIRRIAPQHVVALQRRGEVEPILKRLPRGITVHRLLPSRHVRARSREARRVARARRFRRYFAEARRHALSLTALPASRPARYEEREIPPHRMLAELPPTALRHLLVGLADRDGWLRAVGSVVEIGPGPQALTVVAPVRSLAGVAALQWGVLRVAPSGVEEGRLA